MVYIIQKKNPSNKKNYTRKYYLLELTLTRLQLQDDCEVSWLEGKTFALAAECRRYDPVFGRTFWKGKFESISLGTVLSSHERCAIYNEYNLIMVLYSSLKREPTQSTTLWRFEFVLSHVLGTRESYKVTVVIIKNFCYSTRWWQVLDDKRKRVALLDLIQLQNIITFIVSSFIFIRFQTYLIVFCQTFNYLMTYFALIFC